jgi:two-component system NtrC family sensor kinase
MCIFTSAWGDRVLLEVCDSGAGLSAQVQAQLFQPFFTIKSEGSGLGQWISLELVAAWVEGMVPLRYT